MKLKCAFCGVPLFLDLSNDALAWKELEFASELDCLKNPNPDPEKKKHKFSVIG